MKSLMDTLFVLILSIGWIAGVVIAKGFWSVFFAIIIPFYSWYLVIEKLMIKFSLV